MRCLHRLLKLQSSQVPACDSVVSPNRTGDATLARWSAGRHLLMHLHVCLCPSHLGKSELLALLLYFDYVAQPLAVYPHVLLTLKRA